MCALVLTTLLAASHVPLNLAANGHIIAQSITHSITRTAVVHMADEPPKPVKMKGVFDFEAMRAGIFGGISEMNPANQLFKLFKGTEEEPSAQQSVAEAPVPDTTDRPPDST